MATPSPPDARLLVLPPDDRDRLLASAVDAIRRRLPEAAALLARLARYNPALVAQLRPKQDSLAGLVLRVLLPEAEAVVSTSIPSFIVVSYCWHYPGLWTPAPAAQPQHPRWQISVPMVEAILGGGSSSNSNSNSNAVSIRHPGEGVWFDQLCIDQANTQEKAVAIGAMDVLYRAARRLVIVLEDVQLTTDEYEVTHAYAGFYADMVAAVRQRDLVGDARGRFIDDYMPAREAALPPAVRARYAAAAKPALMRILGSRWISRAWCVHESRVVAHSRTDNPLFLLFRHDGRVCAFEFRFVHFWAMRLSQTEPPPPPLAYFDYLDDPHPQTLTQRYYRLQRCLNFPGDAQPYTQHLVQLLTAECALQQDLVSIGLNTAGLPLAYDGRVAHREEAIWTFGALALAAGDVSPLTTLGRLMTLRGGGGGGAGSASSSDTTSWMLWPAGGVVDSAPLAPDVADSITGVTGAYIEMDILLLAGQAQKPTEASMARAAEILALVREGDDADADADADPDGTRARFKSSVSRIKGALAGPDSAHPDTIPRLLRVFSQTMLALGLDCGLAWMARFPDALLAHTQPPGWVNGTLGGAADERRCGAGVDFLLELYGADRAAYRASALRFLTVVLDDRLMAFTLNPRRVQIAADDWAITTTGADRVWAAVPVALAGLPHWHKRLWYVEGFDPGAAAERVEAYLPVAGPTDTDPLQTADGKVPPLRISDDGDARAPADGALRSNWRIRKRLELWGHAGPLAADGVHVRRVARQRLYGSADHDWAATEAAYRALAAAAAAREAAVQAEAEAEAAARAMRRRRRHWLSCGMWA